MIRSTHDYAIKMPSLAAYERAANAELSMLTPPGPLAADWKQIVTYSQIITADTAKVGEYAASNNVATGRALISAAVGVQKQMALLTRRDGFKACGQVPV